MNIVLTKSNKILLGAAIFLYLVALYISALGILLHIVVIGSAIKILAKSKKNSELATIDLAVLTFFLSIFILVRIGLFWNGYNDYRTKKNDETITNILSIAPSLTPTPSPIPKKLQITQLKDITTASISGLIRRIDKDLEIILNEREAGVDYFEAGKYIQGKFKGYTRIIGFAQGVNQGWQPRTYVFVSLDFEKFILVENPEKVKAYSSDDYRNPMNGLNKKKIEKVEEVESDLPDVITLDSAFALYKRNLQVEIDKSAIVPTTMPDSKFKLQSNFPNYNRISSQNSILKLYAIPLDEWAVRRYGQETVNTLKETTGVIIQDSTGLSYSYNLSRISNIKTNPSFTDNYFDRKNPFSSLFLSIKRDEIQTDKSLFSMYDVALPANCVSAPDTFVVSNISIDQLDPFGKTADKIELFTLKDKSNPFVTLQFESKPGEIYNRKYKEVWSLTEERMVKRPTLEEYSKKNPLLFFKDPWNRWVMLGEFDYQLPGGCGKPVVYLYPEKQEKVTVTFLQPMRFETVIPSYHENWIVSAMPDGTLTDLQPQYTNCDEINSLKKGSEYAAKACKENRYPYLYWSGNTIGVPYPNSIENGWYVKKEELFTFMAEKLKEIGLNQKERNDMMDYWGPQMMSKNAPYYKISFLTTKEMNILIPMNIQPNPNSVLRVFLDFIPLTELPKVPIKPQIFSLFERIGFTVVEWGGLKR